MTAPAYTGRWQFLYSWALLAVDESGRPSAVAGAGGEPLLCLWTDVEKATAALPPGHRLVQSPVRPRIAELPDGIGIAIDPGPDGLVLSAAETAALRPLTDHFPAGSLISFLAWTDLPREIADALRAAAGSYSFVDAVWAVQYRIDDSPAIGCLVYRTEAGSEGQESIVDALTRALDAAESAVHDAGLLGVNVVSYADLPADARAAFEDVRPVHVSAS